MSRVEELQRHGYVYGELHLAIAFTAGLEGDDAKRVSGNGWDKTERLPGGPFGAAYLAGRGERRNPAVVLRPSGLVGIDIDGPDGVELIRDLLPEGLPRTVTVETGKPSGYHLWYFAPEGARWAFVELGPEGVEAKTNQCLIVPPGLHPSGRVYRFAEGRAPWDAIPAVLPLDILEKLGRAAHGDRQRVAATEGPIIAGGRHDHLMRLGCAMRRHGACLEAVEAALLAENAHRCRPPQSHDEVAALALDLTDRYGPTA